MFFLLIFIYEYEDVRRKDYAYERQYYFLANLVYS